MADTYEEYEAECKKIIEENKKYLAIFEEDISNLSDKTINRHISNMDLYLNDYMLYEEARHMQEGIYYVDDFLGYFFIRKCVWSTPATIKSTAASIKKFYKSMANHGLIEKEGYQQLCSTIKEGMDEWQATCAQYNDPEQENPFFSFW